MSDTNQTTLGQDEAYELLSNARRRFVISYLRSQDGRVPLNELSQSLAAWENDIPVDELGDQQIKRIYVSLYQTHLPKLEEAGLIEYDRENSTLEIRREADRLDEYLPTDGSERSNWQLVYGALAGLGLLAYLLLSLMPSAPVSMGQLGAIIIVAFAVASIVHQISRRS
jgi:hypothetical protein